MGRVSEPTLESARWALLVSGSETARRTWLRPRLYSAACMHREEWVLTPLAFEWRPSPDPADRCIRCGVQVYTDSGGSGRHHEDGLHCMPCSDAHPETHFRPVRETRAGRRRRIRDERLWSIYGHWCRLLGRPSRQEIPATPDGVNAEAALSAGARIILDVCTMR